MGVINQLGFKVMGQDGKVFNLGKILIDLQYISCEELFTFIRITITNCSSIREVSLEEVVWKLTIGKFIIIINKFV